MKILSVTVHFVLSDTFRDAKDMKQLQFCLSEPAPPDGAGSDLITVLSGFCHTLYIYIKAAAFLIRSEQQI